MLYNQFLILSLLSQKFNVFTVSSDVLLMEFNVVTEAHNNITVHRREFIKLLSQSMSGYFTQYLAGLSFEFPKALFCTTERLGRSGVANCLRLLQILSRPSMYDKYEVRIRPILSTSYIKMQELIQSRRSSNYLLWHANNKYARIVLIY
ncbi:hypothetical protein [Alicyclobacillus sp. SO9]|uniref:hypothetical protein n=1 Tax=Alicyclobacillus sp. SO9 TaxID=2665646 RepID=UPI0018E72954|nr:hypothetical protein [Alicyclobacillus sp. SO9]QQE80427.1 hypothetical protein GI364_08440 [Alicyclobacillus sp. SO9]